MAVLLPPLQRPIAYRIANSLLGSWWDSQFSAPPDMCLERLCDEAMSQTGLASFGNPWFRRPLRTLLRSIAEEARLNPLGQLVARVHMLKLLKERLWAEYWFREFPEIRRRPLRAPVVVVGPMRSGTTRLHRLLAADDRFAHLRLFETICPVPRPSAINGRDRRPQFAALSLGLLHRANPSTAILHPTGPLAPEEELGLFVASAWGMKHEAQWRIPSYARWCEQEDATPAYDGMADLLRLTGWIRGEDPDKPWLLKTPQHMLDLPALLKVFPEARIIFIHRDPAAVVGSSCSMAWNQMSVHSDHVDPRWIGREWLRKTRLKVSRMAEARALVRPGRMIDVHYDEMDRDWRGAMRRIYAFLDLDMAPAQPAMAGYMERSERERTFRSHSYRLKTFGLEPNNVRLCFQDYMRDFAIPLETGPRNGARPRIPAAPRRRGYAAMPSN